MENMERYTSYLSKVKRLSENSVQAYIRDLKQFERFAAGRGIFRLHECANVDAIGYVMELRAGGATKSTINRKMASLRVFFEYLTELGEITKSPLTGIKTPKIEKKTIEFISVDDMKSLLAQPDHSDKGRRDRAILEVLYGTGIRATELIDMRVEDVNLHMGFVKCVGEHSKARVIPFGKLCREALADYMDNVRQVFLRGRKSDLLFVNYAGGQITRQGLWKILKEYGEAAAPGSKLTPQIIRNSFAVHMLQNGADIKSIQELMGHEDITATMAYLSAIKNSIKDVYDRTHPRA